MPPHERVDYVLLIASGLEQLASEAISAHFAVPASAIRQVGLPPASMQWAVDRSQPGLAEGAIFPGEAGIAKFLVSLPLPTSLAEWAAQHAMLASFPCTQGVLAPLALASDIALTDEGLEQVREVARSTEGWDAAIRTWRYCRPSPPPLAPNGEFSCSTDGLSFRASAVRDGKHSYNSPRLMEVVGGAVYQRRGLRVALKGFDMEVVAIMLQSELLIGLNVWQGKDYTSARLGPEPRPLVPHADTTARLRPSTAWLMVQMAKVQPGDVLIDPMCGVGTLPLVAAAASPCALSWAGDADEHVLVQVPPLA